MPSLPECRIPEQDWLREAGRRNGNATIPPPLEVVPDAGPWEPAVESLLAFQQLGDNWDGQGARAPSHDLLASASGLAYLLSEQGMDPPSRVVPGLEGSVLFEWQWPEGTYCEVEILRPLDAEVMVIEPGQPAQHWTLPTA